MEKEPAIKEHKWIQCNMLQAREGYNIPKNDQTTWCAYPRFLWTIMNWAYTFFGWRRTLSAPRAGDLESALERKPVRIVDLFFPREALFKLLSFWATVDLHLTLCPAFQSCFWQLGELKWREESMRFLTRGLIIFVVQQERMTIEIRKIAPNRICYSNLDMLRTLSRFYQNMKCLVYQFFQPKTPRSFLRSSAEASFQSCLPTRYPPALRYDCPSH